MSSNILIGTSGYSYDDWIGPVYPPGTSKGEFLRAYSARFPLVELNFSYYRQPDERVLLRMVEDTGQGFQFSIKAHKSLTHTVAEDWRTEAKIYRDGIRPLVGANKLAAVLLQFPYSFHYTKENRIYLGNLCSELRELPLVLEFRNGGWQNNGVYEEMRGRNLGFAVADYPDLRNLPKGEPIVTSDIGYIRFHGRNAENWWSGNNASRYDYLYEGSELDEWIDRIASMSQSSKVLVIVFNNHWRGKAVQNAEELKGKLDGQTELNITSINRPTRG